jgi:hypothetical protein
MAHISAVVWKSFIPYIFPFWDRTKDKNDRKTRKKL